MRKTTRLLGWIALLLAAATACHRGDKQSVPAGPPTSGGGITFNLPASWQGQAPESSMRIAQAAIPGAAGPGQLAVFFFGPGQGGPVEDNLQRWIDQIAAEGRSAPQRGTLEANGLQVTWLDVSGTLQPSGMGAGPVTPTAGARLLGAVVEGPGGPWFFKATGPAATLEEQHDAFLELLRSVRSTDRV